MTMLDRLFGGFLAKAAKVDGMAAGAHLRDLAVCANAVDAWFHAAHLATTGTGFAGDHALLYGEIYESAGDAFDALMERAIGLSKDRTLADPASIAGETAAKLGDWPSPVGPAEEIAGGASDVVTYFIDEIKAKTEAMRAENALSQGADNLLAQFADDFEGFGYKLGQRVEKGGERASHKYIRRVPKAGGGYEYIYAEPHHGAAVPAEPAREKKPREKAKPAPKPLSRDDHYLIAHHTGPNTWEVQIKPKRGRGEHWIKVGGARKVHDLREAKDIAWEEFVGSGATFQKGADVDALIAKVMAGGLDKSSAIAALKSRGVIKQDGEHLVMAKQKRKPSVGKYGTAANKRAVEIANGAPMGNRPVQEMLV